MKIKYTAVWITSAYIYVEELILPRHKNDRILLSPNNQKDNSK